MLSKMRGMAIRSRANQPCYRLQLEGVLCLKTKGATLTYAPIQARGCPSRSAFSAPRVGRASSAVLEVEISTFRIEQQPKLREMYFVKSFSRWSLVCLNADQVSGKGGRGQLNS